MQIGLITRLGCCAQAVEAEDLKTIELFIENGIFKEYGEVTSVIIPRGFGIGDLFINGSWSKPAATPAPPTEIEVLRAQLAQADEAALDLYAAQAAQAVVSAQQDEAIIDLYTRIGG